MLFDYKTHFIAGIVVVDLLSLVFADPIHDPTKPKFQGVLESPTVFNAVAQANDEPISLQGIVNKRDTHMAIIDGNLYRQGEMISGYKISQITKNFVVLTKSGSQKRLYVYE